MKEYEIKRVLYYTKEHTWAKKEATGMVRSGITDYAQKQLRDIRFVELPAIGTVVKQMEPYGTVESVKSVSDVYAPVSGTVKDTNKILNDKPNLINDDPYGSGWFILIEPIDLNAELKNLLTAAKYEVLMKQE